MKITIHNLQKFIDKVEHNYAHGTVTFYTKISGYLVPFSIVNTTMEPTNIMPTSLPELDSLGISSTEILRGIERCKLIRGY
ncbi:hypothetical protein pVco7_gp064 [Vibrio phage pVco-7]|uniref:Uncharacterized protein n=1 Tax=Vibrio phage pVco-5 TaxID=1965485 RepID=A0A1W6JUU1_9CAUD|nr:hypothetical protein KNT61_gp065 [Vibrio phage pVco-5]ARM71053.1 hypothetical protein pVco5_065 [Vibrio phage pVco-5]